MLREDIENSSKKEDKHYKINIIFLMNNKMVFQITNNIYMQNLKMYISPIF